MLKTRSKLTASASFFGAALAALIAVSAQPGKAVAFDGAECGGYSNTSVCTEDETTKYCETPEGLVYECGKKTVFTYYPPIPSNG